MRRIARNVFTELYQRGCNASYIRTCEGHVMIDSPQQPIDAVRWRERMEDEAPIRYLVNTEWHGDHIRGNAFFPHVEVIGQEQLAAGFAEHIYTKTSGMTDAEIAEKMKIRDPDSAWLVGHPDYPVVNAPTTTFRDRMTFHLGDHSFHCINLPGHTEPQTAILVPEEGVVFTGDNVFCGCRSFLQEADPWDWLDALAAIEAMDVDTIVPGHGEPCTKAYLKTQGQIIENWLGVVGRLIDQGMTEDEAAIAPIDVARDIDPYPMGQRLFMVEQMVTQQNIRQIHRKLLERAGC